MFDLVGNSVWQLIVQSDFLSKLVLGVLLGMSVLCWTVFLCKLILIRLRKRDLRDASDRMREVTSADDLVALASSLRGTVPGHLLTHSIIILKSIREVNPPHAAEILQYQVDQIVDNLIANEESYLPVLSTSAAVSPLLGLFGTVWGLIHAFIRISEKQAADITVVAPGIAEALMTTFVGLIVAIPALIMYNILAIQVRNIEYQITQLADKMSFIMQQLVGR